MPRRDPFQRQEDNLIAGLVIGAIIAIIMGLRELWRWVTGM